jgi:hypothetical protein
MASAVAGAMAKEPSARPATAGEFAVAMIGSATLVMSPGIVPPVSEMRAGSEEPTVVSNVPPLRARDAEPVPSGRARWSIAAALLGILALAAAALTTDRDPGGSEDGEVPLVAAASTTTVVTTTTTPAATTTATTTTTTTPTTSTTAAETPETLAEEIDRLLAGLQPPVFQPREVRQVGDRLDQVMEEWEADDREELIRELERIFEEVGDLEGSEERDEITAQLVRLAEMMGFEVEQGGGGDGDGDD